MLMITEPHEIATAPHGYGPHQPRRLMDQINSKNNSSQGVTTSNTENIPTNPVTHCWSLHCSVHIASSAARTDALVYVKGVCVCVCEYVCIYMFVSASYSVYLNVAALRAAWRTGLLNQGQH